MDEISIGASTHVAELKDGEVRDYFITPEQFGLERADVAGLAVDSAEQSLEVISGVFAGNRGPARDIVVMNAGAAIYAAGLADSLEFGMSLAAEKLEDGSAAEKLAAFVAMTNSF